MGGGRTRARRALTLPRSVEGGELFDYLANNGPYSEAVAARYMRTMLQALQYLHGCVRACVRVCACALR